MSHILEADLCVIGAGSAGLSVAAGAAQMGARVVLIERGRMGGDCLNIGCVPSKALIAAAHAAHAVRSGGRFGVNGHEPRADFLRVRAHVREVIAGIAPHDSVERFEGLGVTVLQAAARFTGSGEVKAGEARVRAGTKACVSADGLGRAVTFIVAPGQAHELPHAIPLLDRLPGLPKWIVGDRGYASHAFRQHI
jgi:pyruvate/2-oxoglutarate dehydrogenase complex dihydrolipoamide dehydrogenase (E3) component